MTYSALIRFLACVFLLLGSLRPFCQEVVVFKDHRSLVVSGHRQVGFWTYLTFNGGEMAVMTSAIAEFRTEGATNLISAGTTAPSMPNAAEQLPQQRLSIDEEPQNIQAPYGMANGKSDVEEPEVQRPQKHPPLHPAGTSLRSVDFKRPMRSPVQTGGAPNAPKR